MLPLYTALISSALVALLAYLYTFWTKVRNFKDAGVPFVTPYPFVGNMGKMLFRLEPMLDLFDRVYNMCPESKYVGFFDLMSPVLIVRDAELIKTIAIKNSDIFFNRRGFVDETCEPFLGRGLFELKDQRWQKTRATLSPSFTSSKLRGMFGLMSEVAVDFVEGVRDQMGDCEVNMKDVFTRYTNDVIASTAFGIKMDSMRHPNNDFYVMGRKSTDFDGILSLKFFLTRNFPLLTKILRIKIISDEMRDFFTGIISRTVKMRDAENLSRPDMVQLMMETRGKENEMSIEDMAAQAVSFFFAGFDTTSTAMSYGAYYLATHPEVYKRLQEEIDLVWDKSKGEPSYDDINDMEYLEAVVNETLRLHPAGLIVERDCSEPFELPPRVPGAKPYILQPGVNVWFPMFHIQRDPKYWDEPDKFLPERFLKKKVSSSDMTFIPFGMGPRQCIANRFAMLEIKVVFFYLLLKNQLKPGPKTVVPIKFSKKSFIPLPEGGFWLKIQPRVLFT